MEKRQFFNLTTVEDGLALCFYIKKNINFNLLSTIKWCITNTAFLPESQHIAKENLKNNLRNKNTKFISDLFCRTRSGDL